MRILHYALGLPPYRTGGLTKYVTDLMREQQRQGHEVTILWPGRMRIGSRKVSVRRKEKEFVSFELINPLPVPLLQGVADIPAYTAGCDENIFMCFLETYKPDVIEIHTFMGLYREFISASKKLGIPLVFVTHDYYALCPKVNLLSMNGICENGMDDCRCSECNALANPLSLKKIWIMQSATYRLLKNSRFLTKLRKDYKRQQAASLSGYKADDFEIKPYHKLQDYYLGMLKDMDLIHANSNVAAQTYRRLGNNENIKVLTISNENIGDYRKEKHDLGNCNKEVQLLYVGPADVYKGYFLLTEVLDELWQEGIVNYKLHVYGIGIEERPYIVLHKSFTKEHMQEVFAKSDLTLVPSLWKETFGFVAAESLSFGTPVLVTEYVGAKDLIKDSINGFCINPDKETLKSVLKKYLLHEDLREQLRHGALEGIAPITIKQHAKAVEAMLTDLKLEKKEKSHD